MLSMDAIYDYYVRQEEEFDNVISQIKVLKRNLFALNLNEEKASGQNDAETLKLCKKLKQYLDRRTCKLEKNKMKIYEELEEHRQLKLHQIEIELGYFGNIKFKMHNKSSSLTRVCEKVLNSFICPHMNHYVHSIEVAQVTQVIKPGSVSLESALLASDDRPVSIFILCEPVFVQEVYEPFFHYFQQSLFFHEVDEVKYTISKSFCVADSCWHVGTNNERSNKRILSLVFKEVDESLNKMQKDKDDLYQYKFQYLDPTYNKKCTTLNVAYDLVVNPIFLVEYYYVLKLFWQEGNEFNELSKDEIDLIEREPYLPSQCAADSLFCNPKTWGNLVKIAVVKLNLTSFGLRNPLLNVRELDVSYNKLISLTEICLLFPNLEVLKAPFNDIASVPDVMEMSNLNHLDLSWNSLTSISEILNWVKTSALKIKILNLKFNQFRDMNDSSHEIYLVYQNLCKLVQYNDIEHRNQFVQKAKDVYNIDDINKFLVLKQPDIHWTAKHVEVFKLNEETTKKCSGDWRNTHFTVDSQEDLICVNLVGGEQFHELNITVPLSSVHSCTITKNKLQSTHFLSRMKNLMELNLSGNLLESLNIRNLQHLNKIVRLNLSNNYITSLENLKNLELPNLKCLDISKNKLNNCIGIEGAKNIEEFNLSFNNISELDRFLFLKRLQSLKIVDVRKNGLKQMDILKRYLIYHVRTLEYINGSSMTESEITDAHNTVGGVVDFEYLEAFYKNKDIKKINHFNLNNLSIQMIALCPKQLNNIKSVNLENNTLDSIAELALLENIKFLNLAGNQILKFGKAQNGMIFEHLKELHLNGNNIVDLEPLELRKMPNLKTLFLQDNQITCLKGIEELSSLRHLILDRNKISSINANEVKMFFHLKDLYLESNHIHKLDFLPSIKKIMRLFIKNNRIENMETLKFLKYLTKIQELTFSGNPVCRRFESYVKVLTYLPNISYVDGFLIESFAPIETQTNSQ